MKEFDRLPKSVKKTIRYILQDVDLNKLNEIENVLLSTIDKRKKHLQEEANSN